ncbi:MAG: hypothetical protein KDE55_22910 [Novosphingobium sp.]|nr:hypothetical protein [Novosphingobium sp.]
MFAVMILTVISACDQRPDEAENVANKDPGDFAAESAPSHTASNTATVNARIWFEPATLENCTPPVSAITMIKWDASATAAKFVDVKLLGRDGLETLFATSKPIGSKESGRWMFPGSTVVLRDHDSGAELGRGVVEAGPCSH